MPALSHQLSTSKISVVNQRGRYRATHVKLKEKKKSIQNGEQGSQRSHGSLVTFTSENGKETDNADTEVWSELNKKEIYKTVSDWFELWQPWQQKCVLHGITER